MEALIYAGVAFIVVGLITSLIFLKLDHVPSLTVVGAGRIYFLTLLSETFWITFYLLFAVAILLGHPPRWVISSVNLFLVVYLILHVIIVNVALWRWKRRH